MAIIRQESQCAFNNVTQSMLHGCDDGTRHAPYPNQPVQSYTERFSAIPSPFLRPPLGAFTLRALQVHPKHLSITVSSPTPHHSHNCCGETLTQEYAKFIRTERTPFPTLHPKMFITALRTHPALSWQVQCFDHEIVPYPPTAPGTMVFTLGAVCCLSMFVAHVWIPIHLCRPGRSKAAYLARPSPRQSHPRALQCASARHPHHRPNIIDPFCPSRQAFDIGPLLSCRRPGARVWRKSLTRAQNSSRTLKSLSGFRRSPPTPRVRTRSGPHETRDARWVRVPSR
ncbi:hypothetical protein LXA43DRAFT_93074 [Ganoderma leucocontextum]|nr:hypothetical protein LXA43DRAFT_93074 [Ganoderma leucocontextum]